MRVQVSPFNWSKPKPRVRKSIHIGFDDEERTTIWSIVIHAYEYKELIIIHETHRAAE